jgi:phosphate transport system substrate-binding protein
MRRLIALTAALALLAAGAALAAPALKGRITADGSSTVGPWTTSAAELFRKKNPSVSITVGISGTGGGFERFCKGETDLQNASRAIKSSEGVLCRDNGVDWVAFRVASDGIAVVVNPSNTWVDCLTTAELKRIWDTGSKVDNWADVRAGFPNVPLKLFGPGTDSGTFDYFTEAINGKARQSRSDYQASEDDNVLVQGVAGERGGMGYFGLSYYEENRSRLKLVRVNAGQGCVAPSVQTVQNSRYKPLGRPLFVYAKRTSFKRAEVAAFIGFALNNQQAIAKRADYVWLTKKQATNARYRYLSVLKQVFGK